MSTETNQEVTTTPEVEEGQVQEDANERLARLEAELSKRDETIGSLKRELKDYKKPKETPVQKSEDSKPENSVLLEKAFLRTAGITDSDEVELALSTANKWGVSVDALIDDEDFKIKLDKHRTSKANTLATSNIRGNKSGNSQKDDSAYWIARGTPPTPDQVPDRTTRVKITRALLDQAKKGKTFYND